MGQCFEIKSVLVNGFARIKKYLLGLDLADPEMQKTGPDILTALRKSHSFSESKYYGFQRICGQGLRYRVRFIAFLGPLNQGLIDTF